MNGYQLTFRLRYNHFIEFIYSWFGTGILINITNEFGTKATKIYEQVNVTDEGFKSIVESLHLVKQRIKAGFYRSK